MSVTFFRGVKEGTKVAYDKCQMHITCPVDENELRADVIKAWAEKGVVELSELIALGLIYKAQIIGEV